MKSRCRKDRLVSACAAVWLLAACGQTSQPGAPSAPREHTPNEAPATTPHPRDNDEREPSAPADPTREAADASTVEAVKSGCDRTKWAAIATAIGGYDIEAKAHAVAAALRSCAKLPAEISIYADHLAAAKQHGELMTAYVEFDEKVWERWYERSFQDCLPRQCHARYVLDRYLDDEPYTDEKFLSFFGYAIIAWLIEQDLPAEQIRPVANALFEVESVTLMPPPPPPPASGTE